MGFVSLHDTAVGTVDAVVHGVDKCLEERAVSGGAVTQKQLHDTVRDTIQRSIGPLAAQIEQGLQSGGAPAGGDAAEPESSKPPMMGVVEGKSPKATSCHRVA